VDNAARLQALVAKLMGGRPVPLLVRRQDNSTFVALSLPKSE
jgi:hypothetical protein